MVDTIGPEVTCPANQAVDAIGQYVLPDYFATGEAMAVDNCTDPVTIFAQDPPPGTVLDFGVYTIALTATDDLGHVGNCEFVLTVDDALDRDDYGLGTIVLYPNPATDRLMISNPNDIELEQVEIFDLMGRSVYWETLRAMSKEIILDISALQSASYFAIISSKEKQLIKHIIKE